MMYLFEKFCFFDSSFKRDEKNFIEYLGVKKDSFIGNFASRVYKYYFEYSQSINEYYCKYYLNEYKNSHDMLLKKFIIPENRAKEFVKQNFYFTIFKYKTENVYYYFEEEVAYSELYNIFKKYVGGIKIEGKKWFCHE